MMGPAATAMPLTALQMPMAAARSGPWRKTFVMIARVAGKISAAPMPMSARLMMSPCALPIEPASAEVAPKATRPARSARLRPNLSPRPPAARSRPVKTSRYESTIHCSWRVVAASSSASVGSATLTIVPSSTVTNTARHITARVAQRCG